MDNTYDIYVTAHVDAMKAENAELWRKYEEAVNENAMLSERLNRYERAACYRESEREAVNTRQ